MQGYTSNETRFDHSSSVEPKYRLSLLMMRENANIDDKMTTTPTIGSHGDDALTSLGVKSQVNLRSEEASNRFDQVNKSSVE